MPRSGINGTYTLPGPQKTQVPNTPILSSVNNQGYADIEQTFNTPQPIAYGGTGEATAVAGTDALSTKGTDIASATTTDIGAATGRFVHITGTTTITGLGTKAAGVVRFLTFDGILTLTHNATSLILPGATNIVTAAGDAATAVSEGGGNWRIVSYQKASGLPVVPGATLMDSRPSLIVNGNFQMSQENGNTLGTANNFYFADQFFLSFTAATAAMSVQLLTSVRTLSGNDRVGEFKTTTAKASLGATDFVTLSTVIEGSRPEWKAAAFGTAGAKPFVYRFEFTGPAGLYHMHFQNSAGNRHCAVPFTVAAPEANVATVRILVIPADTTGTWLFGDGDKGLVCDLVLAAGATLTGGTASTWGTTARLAATTQFNILSSTSNVARIADVGLKNDPDATGAYGLFKVNEVDPVYRSERYLQGAQGLGSYPGTAQVTATSSIVWNLPLLVPMCVAPSLLTTNGLSNSNSTGTLIAVASALIGDVSSKAINIRLTSTQTGFTAGHASVVVGNSSTSKTLIVARL